MASPTCEVKDGAGAYTSTTNGKDVTPTNTVTIHLVSSAGVNTWSIQCIATDELSDKATVNAGLTIDTVAKTATFTAPAAGRSYLFQSVVNSGIGPDGTVQQSYTTTFGVYTTLGGKRVHSVGETFESNATFGWVADLNVVTRSSFTQPTGTGFTHNTGGVQDAAAKLVENADVATAAAIAVTKLAASGTDENILKTTGGAPAWGTLNLASTNATTGSLLMSRGGLAADVSAFSGLVKISGGTASAVTLGSGVETFLTTPTSANLAAAVTNETGSGALVFGTSPILSGVNWTGAVAWNTNSSTKSVQQRRNPVDVQTTDATVTTLDSINVANNSVTHYWIKVTAVRSDFTQGAAYHLQAAFRNNGGTVTQVGATNVLAFEDNAAWDAALDISGTAIRIRVTGAAGVTVRWGSVTDYLDCIP